MHRVLRVLCVISLIALASAPVLGCATPAPRQSTPEPKITPSTPATESVQPEEQVEVPDLVGFDMVTGRMVIGEAHMAYEVVTDPPYQDLPMNDTVVITKQDPAAGTMVNPGSTVFITIEKKK